MKVAAYFLLEFCSKIYQHEIQQKAYAKTTERLLSLNCPKTSAFILTCLIRMGILLRVQIADLIWKKALVYWPTKFIYRIIN